MGARFRPWCLLALLGFVQASPLIVDQPWDAPSEDTFQFMQRVSYSEEQHLYRLSGDTVPEDYEVFLQIDPENAVGFSGEVSIKVNAVRHTDSFVLHHLNMESSIISVAKLGQIVENIPSFIETNTTQFPSDSHFLIIRTEKEIEAGEKYLLRIRFTATYGDNMLGVYRSSYVNEHGDTRYLATTQFQPWHARSAFPCYDEPGMKANFRFHIYVPDGYHAISNMNEDPSQSDALAREGYKLYKFHPTLKMSTYLLAFVVSDYENLIATSNTMRAPFRVFFRKGEDRTVDFALEFGPANLAAIQDFVNFTYAFPKMDKIAIPDFSAGAMENWGLVTYREEYLMWTQNISTTRNMHNIGTIISHENGHMWFGNEVSPRWWDVLWLNEGFATYFEYYGTNLVHPEWRLMDQFNVFYHQNVMLADSLPSSNPMTNPVFSPSEINGQFNSIAYSKAGSVIKMMAHVLGEEKFKEGLHTYLERNYRGVASPETLYASLDSVIDDVSLLGGHSVATVFSRWEKQAGYPIVELNRIGNLLVAKQKRFYQYPNIQTSEKWYIPINIATNMESNFNDTTATTWMRPEIDQNIIGTLNDEDEWYIINKQETGYYRVNYDDQNWVNLAKALNETDFSGIHVLNRAQIVDDAINLARSGFINYATALDLLRFMGREVDYIPWVPANAGLVYLHRVMRTSNYFGHFERYVLGLVDAVYQKVGYDIPEDEPMVERYNRILALNWACTLGQLDCIERSTLELRAWKEDEDHFIHPDVQSVVLCTALRMGSHEDFTFLWDKYKSSTIASQRSIILSSLGCPLHAAAKLELLNYAIAEDSGIRDQDRHSAVVSVAVSDPLGLSLTLGFMLEHFTNMQLRITSWTGIPTIINNIGLRLLSASDLKTFEDFVELYKPMFTSFEEAAIQNALANSAVNSDWQAKYMPDVNRFLSAAGIASAEYVMIMALSVLAVFMNFLYS